MKLEPDMQIGQYALQERVGVGSSGEIWRAVDGDQRTVAIKFMRDNLLASKSAQKHRQRLEREVKAMQTLAHPNIPILYDYDFSFERPYLVMQFIDSPSLDGLLLSGELVKYPLYKRMHIIRQIASALTLAHEHDIIHRDIKPGNINGINNPYLMDFSIALAVEDRSQTNINIGTSIYMSPDFDVPDALGDSWSFGVVAYEILFGRHPIFDYDDPAIKKGMYARFESKKRLDGGTWFKPSTLGEQLPADLQGADLEKLDAVFTKALGEREDRYVDVNAFVADIEAALTPESLVDPEAAALAESEAAQKDLSIDLDAAAARQRVLMIVGALIALGVLVAAVLAVVGGGG